MIKIIAEIGWNHCGDLDLAKKMAKSAQENGATYAKYQTWSVDRLKPGSWDDDGRRQIYEKAELGCKEVKIPSFESRNHDLLKYCNKHFDVIFMSTGTSTFEEIQESCNLITISSLYLLHCVSSYPCEPKIANIPRMSALKYINIPFTSTNIGYSDHIQGVESAKIAIEFGAQVIEKHFTIDNDLPGRDNKFAILPHDLSNLSSYIQLRNEMMINHGKDFQEYELNSRTNYEGRFNG